MPRKPDLTDLVRDRIRRNRRAAALVREDFLDLGDYDQVGRALLELVRRGELVRVGYGIYGKARRSSITGKPIPAKPLIAIATEGLRKVGYMVSRSKAAAAYRKGRSTQIPARQALDVGKQRVARVIKFGPDKVVYETAKSRRRRAA
ncbi:MAG: hypothetical protein A3I65_05460 [Betaproteobacteria bacterium RIFCSPLOWO2_02_FULL_68_150]|nr:MAG: hypothetical protein A3I65_05460 [Betaproteobacteria bacterium RIFCSPLOWO2_02_FULL_68_150]